MRKNILDVIIKPKVWYTKKEGIMSNKLIKLYKVENFTDNRNTLVIITHGIAEHLGRYDYFTSKLNESGLSVLRYDLRGHGKSEGKKGYVKSFKFFIDDLHALVLEYKSQFKNIFLFGHSMGGEIVNLYSATYHDVKGIVSSAASVDTPASAAILKIIPYKLIGFIKQKTSFGNTLCSNPDVVKAYQEDPLVLPYFYGRLAGEMFINAIRYIKRNTHLMNTPILFIHGAEDKVVSPSFSKDLYDKIKIDEKRIIIYHNARHEVLNEYCKDIVIKDVIDWIKENE